MCNFPYFRNIYTLPPMFVQLTFFASFTCFCFPYFDQNAWCINFMHRALHILDAPGPWAETMWGLGKRSPKNLRWGDCPCIRPPIFKEVLLWDVRQSTNWLRKGVKEEYFCLNLRFLVKKWGSYMLYIRFQTKSSLKKVVRNFGR